MRAYVVDDHDASWCESIQRLFHLESHVTGGMQAVMNEEIDPSERAKQRR
jgi:hypothetical protein